MSKNATSIDILTPTALSVAGVPIDDALWLHGRSRGMPFTQALGTERGRRILEQVRAYGSP